MVETKLPEFKGKPIVPKNAGFPEADFLSGKVGKWVNAEVQGKYGSYDAIACVKYADGIVKRSTPFYAVAANEFLSQVGARIATLFDLENIIDSSILDLRGTYEDSALVLRSDNEPNSYLSTDLNVQAKARNKNLKLPIVISLADVVLARDKNSQYGLKFNLKENAKLIYAPQLDNKNYGRKFDRTDENGLPVFDENGKRTLYTRETGLSRLYLGGDLGLYSDWDDLADFNDYGRVVVVSAEGASPQLQEFLSRLEIQRAEQIKVLEERFEKAKSVLLGNNKI